MAQGTATGFSAERQLQSLEGEGQLKRFRGIQLHLSVGAGANLRPQCGLMFFVEVWITAPLKRTGAWHRLVRHHRSSDAVCRTVTELLSQGVGGTPRNGTGCCRGRKGGQVFRDRPKLPEQSRVFKFFFSAE